MARGWAAHGVFDYGGNAVSCDLGQIASGQRLRPLTAEAVRGLEKRRRRRPPTARNKAQPPEPTRWGNDAQEGS